MNRNYFILAIVILLTCCKPKEIASNNDFYIENDSINLYAFIGEKISLEEFDPNENNAERIEIDSLTGEKIIHKKIVMDNAFKAKYKVIKNVFNKLKTDTITFVVYDHYGRPKFEKYQNVLLYISKNTNEKSFYHQKYLFDIVIKNSNEKWTGTEGRNLKELFEEKQNGVLKERKVFN